MMQPLPRTRSRAGCGSGSESARGFMELIDRKWLMAALAAISLLASPAQAKYPDKSVRIVLPFAAGGVADITARIVAEKLGDKLGQRFYVENQAGAGGIVAAKTVISYAVFCLKKKKPLREEVEA